jgi:hypothetical protein
MYVSYVPIQDTSHITLHYEVPGPPMAYELSKGDIKESWRVVNY